MLNIAGALLLLVSGNIDVPAIDGIDIRQTVERYPITDSQPQGMLEQMQALSPVHRVTGQRHFGMTDVWLRWNYALNPRNGICRLDRPEVVLEVIITLPDWQPAAEPDGQTVLQWREYIAALIAHELHHRAIAVTAAEQVRDALKSMPPTPCAEARAAAERVAQPILQRAMKEGDDYDVRTDHGLTEGAVWKVGRNMGQSRLSH